MFPVGETPTGISFFRVKYACFKSIKFFLKKVKKPLDKRNAPVYNETRR